MKFDAILIDAGTGNLHSVHNALRSLGYAIHVTADPARLARTGAGAAAGRGRLRRLHGRPAHPRPG